MQYIYSDTLITYKTVNIKEHGTRLPISTKHAGLY